MPNPEKRNPKPDRGSVSIDEEECKGCGLCVEACPPNVLHLSEHINHYGYQSAIYEGAGCTGCGICFLACPEPGVITVLRLAQQSTRKARTESMGGLTS